MTANLNIETIRQRAAAFAKEFAGVTSEKQRDQDFMRGFCEVFGISSNRMAWQFPVNVGPKTINYIDGLLPGMLLIEMKSAGEDLEAAYAQALGYKSRLKPKDAPQTVIVSDFARLHVYLSENGERLEINLCDLPDKIDPLKFLAGYETIAVQEEVKANESAAEKMAGLHDAIKATGYDGKDLETYLVRLLFCLFADDTGLFGENGRFLDLLINHTNKDGSDLHGQLALLFDTLDKPENRRLKNLPEYLTKFPHVNGALFKERIGICQFEESTRYVLIECAQLDWSRISPAIFGSLFQAIMHFDDEAASAKPKKRREFGAHYTSEENILKAIKPLFLDGLWEEFKKLRNNRPKLGKFHERLRNLHFFDPACGCGNFLVIAYRELRLLELETIEALHGKDKNISNVELLVRCNVDQFHGIEIDGSAAQIAKVALWLTDHQMNIKVRDRLGGYEPRLPLKTEANIVCGNALRMDWAEVLPPEKCGYIMGNPPFIGSSYQSKEQKADLDLVCKGIEGAGVLDYVVAWHIKATKYIKTNPAIPVAFVSTNSICQGEQVGVLWPSLLAQGVSLHFAHRTFRWSNEGRGVAAVHCVIVGFGLRKPNQCRLFTYADISGEPMESQAAQINPYLVDAPMVFIAKRRKPLCADVPEMIFGSKPTDGGNLLLTQAEAETIRQDDPVAARYIKRFLGSEEFINGIERYCLWLADSTAQDRKASPEIQRRMQAVKAMRLASPKIPTQKLADQPFLFGEIRQTNQPYLLVPSVSSEQRLFVPIGYMQPDVIASNLVFMLPNATRYHFGLLCSTMHNAWMRTVCGRLKSDYRYSNTIVYNNFPWPSEISTAHREKIEAAAQAVLDARAAEEKRCAELGQACTLAALYSPGNLPPDLAKAHAQLDKAVDAAYGYKGGKDDAARVAFLFEQYQKLVAPLQTEPEEAAAQPAKRAKKAKA